MKTVKIGNLEWAAKNLDIVVDGSWDYDNDPANREKYGRLYKWSAAKKAVEMLGDGWRLPTREDWDNLIEAVGGKDIAGKTLKSKIGWNDNGNGTNDFGFSALPGGYRFYDVEVDNVDFDNVGRWGFWWMTTENGSDCAYYRDMYSGSAYVSEKGCDKSFGFSVRCVRNIE